ncbi:ribonuclease P protein subunit [Candidatus Woesearchaeota archaeon]|nr:ribonuclease P protein subunit [Candidatus Woesearchaeota archaeon]
MIKQEIIGKEIEIIEADNKNLIGLKGKVIWETKNMLVLKAKNKTKHLIKSQIKFKIGSQIINGKEIIKKPEDRIK